MTKKFYSVFISCVLTTGFSSQSAQAKKHKNDRANGEGCDQTYKALIASGADLAATDANGLDALSRASSDRDLRLFNLWGTHRPKVRTALKLNCPAAVQDLTEAGADPWKAKFYQNPRLNETQPQSIAVIRVDDNRENKGDSEKLLGQMTTAVELQLSASGGTRPFRLLYPIVRLSEVRQKFLAAGFTVEEAVAPDRVKACKALGADSVFEASLEDYRSRNLGVAFATGMRMKFALTDCKTGELLWRSDQDYAAAVGLIIKAFGANRIQEIITGTLGGDSVSNPTIPAVAFPPYEVGSK